MVCPLLSRTASLYHCLQKYINKDKPTNSWIQKELLMSLNMRQYHLWHTDNHFRPQQLSKPTNHRHWEGERPSKLLTSAAAVTHKPWQQRFIILIIGERGEKWSCAFNFPFWAEKAAQPWQAHLFPSLMCNLFSPAEGTQCITNSSISTNQLWAPSVSGKPSELDKGCLSAQLQNTFNLTS